MAERVGFEPNSNARSALLDALETARSAVRASRERAMMAERVGLEPLLVVKTKNLRILASSRSAKSARKQRGETRIEHADVWRLRRECVRRWLNESKLFISHLCPERRWDRADAFKGWIGRRASAGPSGLDPAAFDVRS
jgi:hypothetical protein